jgi:hypothetical protein
VETTFGRAVTLLRRLTGVVASKATARRRAYAAGEAALALEERERRAIAADPPPVTPGPAVLQLSVDATTVQLVGGEYTEVKLAGMAEVVQKQDKDGHPIAKASNLTYAVRWESATQFGQTLTLEAQRRHLDGAATVVSPNDGAVWIQETVVDLVAPQAVRILDEPHAAEHLGLLGQLAYGPTGLAAGDWVARQRQTLLTQADGPALLLAELDRLLAAGPHPAAPRTAEDPDPVATLAREVAYFHKRQDQIRYVHFRQQGYPIGSGIVESGHAVVIAPRCKRAGMRWAPEHLNPLLVLRGIEANERMEATAPAIWREVQARGRQAQRAAQQERRAVRLVARQAAAAPEAAETNPAPQSVTRATTAVATPAAAAAPSRTTTQAATAAARPASPPPTRKPPPGRRRPAPNHPWRAPFLAPSQPKAS